MSQDSRPGRPTLRVAVAGLGAVGLKIAETLDKGVPGCVLAAVSAKDKAAAAKRLAHLSRKVPVLDVGELEPLADIVVECAPAELLPAIAEPFLKAGKMGIALSARAILSHEWLLDLARQTGGKTVLPSGALIALLALAAAAEGTIHAVRMVTRKPVRGLAGAPYLVENNITIDQITEPLRIFSGTPREAAIGFPANLNVSVALALAGIGPDRTSLEIWADPALERNVHTIEVEAEAANFTMTIANVPSENPKTGRITALSVIACLRKLGAPLRVGT